MLGESVYSTEIPFPIIEDLSMKVANAYGMFLPGAADTSAVRATFIIDPEGILRAMVYYPMSNGRSIPEFLRLIKVLQTSDANGIATPEGWQRYCQVKRKLPRLRLLKALPVTNNQGITFQLAGYNLYSLV